MGGGKQQQAPAPAPAPAPKPQPTPEQPRKPLKKDARDVKKKRLSNVTILSDPLGSTSQNSKTVLG